MKRPTTPQSALRAPLNSILGSEANVRLLRELILAETSLTAGELARRAVLGRTSVYPVLESLEVAGIVEFLGAGAQRQVRYRKEHPLASPIAALFRQESDRVHVLSKMLGDAVATIKPAPTSAWLEGDVLVGRDRIGETITCVLLGDPGALPQQVDALSRVLSKVERKLDVHIEVRGITRSELASRTPSQQKQLADAILLHGVPPAALLPLTKRSRAAFTSHADHDVGARRLGIAIAEKLKRDPGLIPRAIRRVRQRMRTASPQEGRELEEWLRALMMKSPSRLRQLLEEPTERATRLRQTLPMLDLLTLTERDAVLASTSDAEARAVVLGKSRASRRVVGDS
jgi:hypothetical protein